MKAFTWFLFPFVLLSVVGAVIYWTINSTILNPTYLSQTAKTTGVYTKISQTIPEQILSNATDLPPKERNQLQQILNQVITPEEVQSKIDPLITDLKNYLNGTQSQVSIDLSDVATKLQKAGIQLSVDSLNKPIVIIKGDNPQVSTARKAIIQGGSYNFILAIVLLSALLGASIASRRFGSLITILVLITVITAILYFSVPQGIVYAKSIIPQSPQSQLFLSVFDSFLTSVGHDMAQHFLVIAMIAFVLAVIFIIISRKYHPLIPATLTGQQKANSAGENK